MPVDPKLIPILNSIIQTCALDSIAMSELKTLPIRLSSRNSRYLELWGRSAFTVVFKALLTAENKRIFALLDTRVTAPALLAADLRLNLHMMRDGICCSFAWARKHDQQRRYRLYRRKPDGCEPPSVGVWTLSVSQLNITGSASLGGLPSRDGRRFVSLVVN